MYTILLVDDDEEVIKINAKFLTANGYRVFYALNSVSGYKLLKKEQIDCIVLDIMLPDVSGLDAFVKYRELTNVPIIFLSSLAEETDKVKGLMLGADDYMTKPYSLKELSARIYTNILRHRSIAGEASRAASQISFPPLMLDLNAHKVFCNDEDIPVSNREFEFLAYLMRNPNRELTFEQIGSTIWNNYTESDRRTIMVVASRLRKKLEVYPLLENCIETVWSVGYKFVPSSI